MENHADDDQIVLAFETVSFGEVDEAGFDIGSAGGGDLFGELRQHAFGAVDADDAAHLGLKAHGDEAGAAAEFEGVGLRRERDMAHKSCEELVGHFDAAGLLVPVGCFAVEVSGCHGRLLAEYSAGRINLDA
jgi:hypothetical protein